MKFDITDANGKRFSGDTDSLFNITGDFNAEDGMGSQSVTDAALKNRIAVSHKVEYYDMNNNPINVEDVLKDAASGKTKIVAIDADIEATHSGKNHNYCIYYEDSMEKDAESFNNPFDKPMLKNHNQYSGEPIGRIKSAFAGPSKLTDERSAIHVKARITDKDAIHKFLDGRYNTVSIGGSMGTVTCNICGKTILKDGKVKFCGHWRGESYKDQLCYWGVRDIEYNELSVVNCPADDYAQTMKVTVITDSNENKDNKITKKEENGMDGNNTVTDAMANATNDIIDSVLNQNNAQNDGNAPEQAVNTDATETTNVTDNAQDNAETTPEGQGNDSNAEDTANSTNELQTALDSANAEVTRLTAENKSLTDAVAAANASVEKLTADLEASKTECDALHDKCVMLAMANKKHVVDSIIERELACKTLAEDGKQAREEELMKLSMKELNSVKVPENTTDQKQRREMAHVANPTLAVDDKLNGEVAEVTDKADNKDAKKTVDDFANEIVGKLLK